MFPEWLILGSGVVWLALLVGCLWHELRRKATTPPEVDEEWLLELVHAQWREETGVDLEMDSMDEIRAKLDGIRREGGWQR